MTTLEERFSRYAHGYSNTKQLQENAQQCAQICEEVSGEFAEFASGNGWIYFPTPDHWYNPVSKEKKSRADLFTLFLNQKQ